MALMAIIVVFSILFQLTAAVLAVRLIRITKRKIAWLLIAFAIAFMTLRRIESLATLLHGGTINSSLVIFEVIGLTISILMLSGIHLIKPLFTSLARSEEELRALNVKLAAFSQEQETLIAELQKALASIKTLKGMLPICASCKKIRDDKGYWNQIEAYVSEHSEAEFTHALCPECAKTLYPELYPDDKSGT
jgi:hypothetical protein